MYDENKVEEIKKSVIKFIEDSKKHPTTKELRSFLDTKSPESLIAVAELVMMGGLYWDPFVDAWMILGSLPKGAVSLSISNKVKR